MSISQSAAAATIAKIQGLIKQPPDGTWSPTDQAALAGASVSVKQKVQALLGVVTTGWWGPISQGALDALNLAQDGWTVCEASSFADPKDLEAFKACKRKGKTDLQCFAVGDNGVGQFGDITAQTVTPFVAIHRDYMISRWGSIHAAAHREVLIWIGGLIQKMKVGDRISARGRIDLNPAACNLWKLRPPVKVVCRWKWA